MHRHMQVCLLKRIRKITKFKVCIHKRVWGKGRKETPHVASVVKSIRVNDIMTSMLATSVVKSIRVNDTMTSRLHPKGLSYVETK